MNDISIFKALRDRSLNFETEAEWDAHYAALLPWLSHSMPDIRKMALERMATSAFWAEGSGPSEARPTQEHLAKRVQWVLEQTEHIHKKTGDTIPLMLREMRYNWPHNGTHIAQDWLRKLIESPPQNVTPDVLEGTLLINLPETETVIQRALSCLDDPSDYLRACAARCLSEVEPELTGYSEADLFALIQEKEIARPGIAGPFLSEWHFDYEHAPIDPIAWMMEILEKRNGPEPDGPFNGVDFYLHEICAFSPDSVRRMLELGHLNLAIETATEIHAPVIGMQAVLEELGHTPNKDIATRAHFWLALYYNHIHERASDTHIKRLDNGYKGYDTIKIRYGSTDIWSEGLVIYAPTGLSDTAAWSLATHAKPTGLEGQKLPSKHLKKTLKPTYEFAHKTVWQLEGGLRVEFMRDPVENENITDTLWTHLFIYAPRLLGSNSITW